MIGERQARRRLSALVGGWTGHYPDPERVEILQLKLDRLLAQEGLPSVVDLVAELERRPDGPLRRATIEALLNCETSFFRDPRCFARLREALLPELIERRRGARRLTIWSAACASGQEPYSLALMLHEHFGAALAGWRVDLLATDISGASLDRARLGLYSQFEVGRGLPTSLLVRHFKRRGLEWELSPEIRRKVTFGALNLIDPWPPQPTFDLILLRNVLIYQSPQTKRLIIDRVRGVLAPDGYLLLGGTEALIGKDWGLVSSLSGRVCVYQRA